MYFQRKIELLAFFQITSLFYFLYEIFFMKNLLWITDYTYLHFIDYEPSTFSYDISEILIYLEIVGMLDAVLKVVLE